MQPQTSRKAAALPRAGANLPDREVLLDLFEKLVLLRRFEQVAQIACRKGETPGFLHLYLGEEATGVGICAHLRQSDWVTSTHRGHGHALAKGADPGAVMAELFGKRDGICGGRGGTMHLYDRSVGLFGTNGIVGAGIGHALGIGLGARQRGTDDIGVAFFGDGASNHGAFHEAMNLAAVTRAPAVFVCENNLYATATPLKYVTLNPEIASRAAAYGMRGVAVDGNDVMAVYDAMKEASERARAGDGPTLIEAKTYRTVGHHEGDPLLGTYRTQEELDAWLKRDPIDMFRNKLLRDYKAASEEELAGIEAHIETVVQDALEFARNSPEPDPATVYDHVLADPVNPPEALRPRRPRETKVQGWLDAVRDGIAEEMRANPTILYFGEGTGERGGSFAHTKNLWHEFGPERMVDTPISEQGFTAAAIGASASGTRCVSDLMFADFMFETAGQIILQAGKLRYMSNGKIGAPVVIRVAAGALRSSGPHHSGSYHPMFAHNPGLVVCVPSTPADAKGLMKTALRASDPVLMMEPKALFASKGPVPAGTDHYVPFGVARIAREGRDLTIVATGQLVPKALEAAEILAAEGIEVEVIDPRTILPLDVTTIVESLRKTHRALVCDEAFAMCGLGGEIAQTLNELAFDEIDAPVGRLHTEAVSHPFAPVLERAILVDVPKIVAAVKSLIAGIAPVPRHWAQPGLAPAPPLVLDGAGGGAAAGSKAGASAIAAQSGAADGENRSRAGMGAASSGGERASAEEPARKPSAPPADPDDEPVTMPFGDLTVSEGVLIAWHKAAGDLVKQGETIAEIETDKAVVEIDAPASGRLSIDQQVGAVVPMGGRIGGIRKPSA